MGAPQTRCSFFFVTQGTKRLSLEFSYDLVKGGVK
jgi:hypothetical protein